MLRSAETPQEDRGMAATQRKGLIVQEVHDEILVFHPERNEASALNKSAAIVFELCDGEHDVEAMRAALDDAGLGPASADAIWLALDELAAAGLIDLTIPPVEHKGRRELLKKLGVGAAAAAIALPVVETIGAPPASAQGSRPSTTVAPTTAATTVAPTTAATTVGAPTAAPTPAPTVGAPTAAPTPAPTVGAPTAAPTPAPTVGEPTAAPTPAPTVGAPAPGSTPAPTPAPAGGPPPAPTGAPTAAPTTSPTVSPTVFFPP